MLLLKKNCLYFGKVAKKSLIEPNFIIGTLPVRPNLQQMPPSSAHQAKVGIPGGFNPRQPMNFQNLQGPYSSQQAARYPNPENAPGSTSAGNQASKIPPMPPVVSNQASLNQSQSANSASNAVRWGS